MMHRRPVLLTCFLIFLILSAVSLGGCGQKGDLYLPDPEQETGDKAGER